MGPERLPKQCYITEQEEDEKSVDQG